jgi:hypothetical protein
MGSIRYQMGSIMGRSANGLLEWKDSFGNALRDIEKQEISKAD